MAYHKPIDLDGFIELMGKTDMRIRAQLADDLVAFLSDADNSIECVDLGLLIDGLVLWMNGSHFKVSHCIIVKIPYFSLLELISWRVEYS